MAVPSFSEGSSASNSPLVSSLGLEWAKIQTSDRCHLGTAAIFLRCSPSAARRAGLVGDDFGPLTPIRGSPYFTEN
jgi:hypothetical protein